MRPRTIQPVGLVLSKFLAPVSVLLEIAIVLQLALGEYVEGSIIAMSDLRRCQTPDE
jgi:hypothetical protein